MWAFSGQHRNNSPWQKGHQFTDRAGWPSSIRTEHTAAKHTFCHAKCQPKNASTWTLLGATKARRSTRARRQHHVHHLKSPCEKSSRFSNCFLTLQPSSSPAIRLLFQTLSVTMVFRPSGSPHQLYQNPLNNKRLKSLDISVIPAKGVSQFSFVPRADALRCLRVS